MELKTWPLVSIGLVVRNESFQIESCLEGLTKNHRNPYPIEIILVDNHSRDETVSRARDFFSNRLPLLKVHLRTFNHMAEARNDALNLAQGAFIAFTDADCRVSENWIRLLMEDLEKAPENVAGVGGTNAPPISHPFRRAWDLLTQERFLHTGSLQAHQAPSAREREVSHLTTSNVLFKKNNLIAAGGFNPSYSTCGEDLDLSYRLISMGFHLLHSADSRIEHQIPTSWIQWLRKCAAYGEIQWQVLGNYSWKIDLQRRAALSMVILLAFLIALWPPLWVYLTLAQLAWLTLQTLFRGQFKGSLKAIAWVMLTQQTYALASLSGALRAVFFKRKTPAPKASPAK